MCVYMCVCEACMSHGVRLEVRGKLWDLVLSFHLAEALLFLLAPVLLGDFPVSAFHLTKGLLGLRQCRHIWQFLWILGIEYTHHECFTSLPVFGLTQCTFTLQVISLAHCLLAFVVSVLKQVTQNGFKLIMKPSLASNYKIIIL